MKGDRPLVSVWIVTYNQQEFISQCIEGALMQVVDFPIEIIIGEDCSTDRTREICLSYQEKFPDIIKVIENEVNLGLSKNWINTLKACKGRYIALCEGDDYWTEPMKLQKQLNFLEENVDISLVKTKAKVFDQALGKFTGVLPKELPVSKFNMASWLEKPVVFASCTFMFKNNLDQEFYERFCTNTTIFGDGRLVINLLKGGNSFYVLDDVTSVYRVNHGNNLTSNKSNEYFIESWLNYLKNERNQFSKSERRTINQHIAMQFERAAGEKMKKKEYLGVVQYVLESFFYHPIKSTKQVKDLYWRVFKS